MDFVAIDVETANADLASICQVGVASFRDGQLADSWKSLVNPNDEFSSINVSIHGIRERDVQHAPGWTEVLPHIASRLNGHIAVCHTPFDRHALGRACIQSGLPTCGCDWLDSSRVARVAWPEFSRAGYGLSNLAAHFGIKYRAHDAFEDARCAGLLLIRAISETGTSVEKWVDRLSPKTIYEGNYSTHHSYRYPAPVKRSANPEGALFGEIIVFTGSLSISRSRAADIASLAGCRVDNGVTKHTTVLVVGDQDLRSLAGHDKSSKHLKAELLIQKGQSIRILGESDFLSLISQAKSLTDA